MEIDPDRVLRSPWIAGGLGALVGLAFAPGATWRERAFNVLCGGLCAGYITPALTEWLRIEPAGMKAFAAFAVGMFGLSVAAEAARWIKAGGVGQLIAAWFNRKAPPP
jgi:hypothetical protein